VIDRQEQRLVAGDRVVQQMCGGAAGASVGAVSAPVSAPAFLQGDRKCRLGKLDGKDVAGDDGDATVAYACEEVITYGVERLRGEQGLDDEAGVQGDRVGKDERLFLDREHTARGGATPACRTRRGLPRTVHIARDADLDPKTLGGPLQGRPFFLVGLVDGRNPEFCQPLGAERLRSSVGLCFRHSLRDGSSHSGRQRATEGRPPRSCAISSSRLLSGHRAWLTNVRHGMRPDWAEAAPGMRPVWPLQIRSRRPENRISKPTLAGRPDKSPANDADRGPRTADRGPRPV
jgi:hypothetical protein